MCTKSKKPIINIHDLLSENMDIFWYSSWIWFIWVQVDNDGASKPKSKTLKRQLKVKTFLALTG